MQQPPIEDLALSGEAAALVIGQPETSAAELLLENAVFLDEVRDDLRVLAV